MLTRLLWRFKAFLNTLTKNTNAHSPRQIKYAPTEELTDYTEEFINFQSGNLRLCGTLTRPSIDRKCPAIILIHGSGPHTRDEIIGPHKPFQLLADYLSHRGIAVLRYDKRGVAYSDGNYETATSLDFADDAEAAFKFLQARNDIDTQRIGLLGHSEGGMIAPIVANRLPQTAFLVLLAAPAIPSEKTLIAQVVAYTTRAGLNKEHINHEVRLAKNTYAIVRSEPDNAIAAEKIRLLRSGHPNDEIYRVAMDAGITAITSPWFRYFLKHDPQVYLKRITCPVLALNGGKDTQVFADENLDSIKAHVRHALTVKLVGLNHIFQPCKTGLPDEYETLPDTMSPVVPALIHHFVTHTPSTLNT